MKIELKNIGGLVGVHKYELQPGFNRIVGPNASGKTSIIRGIESLIRDNEEFLNRTLNSGVDDGYIIVGDYKRSLRRINPTSARGSHDDVLLEKMQKQDADIRPTNIWAKADNIVFFTPESKVVSEIEQGRFKINRYIDDITDAKEIMDRRRDVANQLEQRKREMETNVKRLMDAQKNEGSITVKTGFLARYNKEKTEIEANIEKESGQIDLRRISKDIQKKKDEIESLEESLGTRDAELDLETKNYDEAIRISKSYESEIQKLIAEKEDSDVHINNVNEKIKSHEGKKLQLKNEKQNIDDIQNLVKSAYSLFTSGLCPCCESPVTHDLLDKRRESLRLKSVELVRELAFESEQVKILQEDLRDLKGVSKRLDLFNIDQQKYKRNATLAQKEMKELSALTDRMRSELTEKQSELESLESKYDSKKSNLRSDNKNKLNKLMRDIITIESEIKELKQKVFSLTKEIPDFTIGESVDDYSNKKAKVLKDIFNILKELDLKYEYARHEAMKMFNSTIPTVYQNLGFNDNFDEMKLIEDESKEIQFYIKRKGGIPQNINTLSKAEQLTVSLVLQLSAKEAYIPDFPFFVLDESTNAYDEDRLKNIINYLSNSSTEYIIFSQKVPYSEQKEVVIEHDIA